MASATEEWRQRYKAAHLYLGELLGPKPRRIAAQDEAIAKATEILLAGTQPVAALLR